MNVNLKNSKRKLRETSWTPVHDAVEQAGDFAESGFRSVGLTAGAFLDALFTDLTNLGSARPVAVGYTGERNPFLVPSEEATKQTQHEQHQKADDEWSQRSKASYGE